MTLYIGGFSRFVTSTTAPIATGWSESCRAGVEPAELPRLSTAHDKMKLYIGKFLTIHSNLSNVKFTVVGTRIPGRYGLMLDITDL